MKWTTAVNVKSRLKINYEDEFIFIGSCFSENISEKMQRLGFQTWTNPLGIMYNPSSVRKSLELVCGRKEIDPELYVERNEHQFHYDFHSQNYFKSTSEFTTFLEEQAKSFDEIVARVQEKASHLNVFITLGTAWVYRHKKTSELVANCHKQQAELFDKVLLTEKEVIDELAAILNGTFPKETNFIFTVSPIRHIKDGMTENQVSKSRLLSAVYEICQGNENAQYFPAYEIMMDELRDYRFYKPDLLHPNEMAIDHIWQNFQKEYMDTATAEIMSEYKKLLSMQEHRSLFPESKKAIDFQDQLAIKVKAFQEKFPQVKVGE